MNDKMQKQYVLIEQKKGEKKGEPNYEIFHILPTKDVFDKEILTKNSVGLISKRNLEAQAKEHEIQLKYRQQLLAMIADMEKKGIKKTDVNKVLEEYKKDHKETK